MQVQIHKTVIGCLVAAGAMLAAPASAYEGGDWLVKAGITHVAPKSNNGKVINNSVGIDVGSSTRPSVSLTYMATRNVGVELLGAFPFKHDIKAQGLGNIGSTKQLPPTLSLQWHFLPDAKIQPYVGVGVNYTTFFSTKSSLGNLKLQDSWGLAAQLGVDVQLTDRWFMNADIRYIDIQSKVKLNGQNIGKVQIDPIVATVGIGYRF
ncbi:MAG TPA: OmpW family outer membrane protein [Candidimonas sp.]|nr:OmpW family outer membrane protein [Candidimonas sp.]